MTNPLRTPTSQLSNKIGELYHCADCNYCVDAVWAEREWDHVCPTLSHHSPSLSYSGRGYMSLARAIHEGAEFPLEDIAERVFTCTSCGNCERVCPIGLSPREVNIALREMMVSNDSVPAPLVAYKEKLLSADKDYTNRETLDTVDALFLGGCKSNSVNNSDFALVKRLNPNAELLGGAGKCCGGTLSTLGFEEEASQATQQLFDEINIYPRVEHIIVADPNCLNSISTDERHITLPRWLSIKLSHTDIRITPRTNAPSITYMDDCSDGTWNADMREMLKNLVQQNCITFENPDSGSALSMCCGAGGGLPLMAEDSATRMAQAKMGELHGELDRESVLLIANPNCLAHMKTAHEPSNTILGLGEFLTKYFDISSGQANA